VTVIADTRRVRKASHKTMLLREFQSQNACRVWRSRRGPRARNVARNAAEEQQPESRPAADFRSRARRLDCVVQAGGAGALFGTPPEATAPQLLKKKPRPVVNAADQECLTITSSAAGNDRAERPSRPNGGATRQVAT